MTRKLRLTPLTIFNTPLLNSILRGIALLYLKLAGWRLTGAPPAARRFVLIAAPHTSNWDLPMMLVIVFAFRLKVRFLAKHTLFTPPFGIFLRWLGGIPVKRDKSHNLVEQVIELFRSQEDLILVVPPEGTRKEVRQWKSGFYYISYGAEVPIALGFADFRRKVAGFGGTFLPGGDYAADLQKIQEFYRDISGKKRSAAAMTGDSGEQRES